MPGGDVGVPHTQLWGLWDLYFYRVRRGARAPWGAMMGRNDQNGEMARIQYFLHSFLMK